MVALRHPFCDLTSSPLKNLNENNSSPTTITISSLIDIKTNNEGEEGRDGIENKLKSSQNIYRHRNILIKQYSF